MFDPGHGKWRKARSPGCLILRVSYLPLEAVPSTFRPYSPASPTAQPVSHGGCVSQGAQLVFRHKEGCAFPGSWLSEPPRLPGSLSVSDFNKGGWTLEATWWNDSQVIVPSQRAKRHIKKLPEETASTLPWWGMCVILALDLGAWGRRTACRPGLCNSKTTKENTTHSL